LFFFVAFFTAINSPFALLRLVYALAPASLAFTCVRFFTAPLRALSPVGLFVATASSQKAPHQGGAGKASDFPKAGTIRKCCALGFVPPLRDAGNQGCYLRDHGQKKTTKSSWR
jgi:hypothetical protein